MGLQLGNRPHGAHFPHLNQKTVSTDFIFLIKWTIEQYLSWNILFCPLSSNPIIFFPITVNASRFPVHTEQHFNTLSTEVAKMRKLNA